jgi:multidrug efflux system membrane fusion protein
MLRRLYHPATLIAGVVILVFGLYEISVRFFAYTADAYVMSDIVVVSSEVSGPISRLVVQNNQEVSVGDLLFEVEKTPFQLRQKQTQAALDQAKADLDLANDEVKAAQAAITSAQAIQTNAQAELDRIKSLTKQGFSTEASLDIATRDLATATASVIATQAQLGVATRRVAVVGGSMVSAQAAVDDAVYNLAKCTVTAPEAGRIAPFSIRQGDYLTPGTEVLALVTNRRPRIVANIAERHLARLRVGQGVLLTLGSQPWTLHRGKVSGIAVGVARSPGHAQVLPYVQPTTDWVRLPQRFPVEITLGEWPADVGLFNGADARVLVWF